METQLEGTFENLPETTAQASANRGLSSESNEQFAQDLGVKHVILPKRGYRSKSRLGRITQPGS